MSSNLLLPQIILTATIHFAPSPTFECALSFFHYNKQIYNTSVATVAIKGEFQAYMKRTTGEGKGTKDVTGAQWQRQGERDNTHVCKILRIGPSNSTCVICHLSLDWVFSGDEVRSCTIDLRCTAWGRAAGLF